MSAGDSPARGVLRREWRAEPGAGEDDLRALAASVPFALPGEYLDLLRATNGGEGELGVEPGWFQLHDTAQVLELLREGADHGASPAWFVIGGSGGLETIALVVHGADAGRVVRFDPVAGPASALTVADSLTGFIELLGRRMPGGD